MWLFTFKSLKSEYDFKIQILLHPPHFQRTATTCGQWLPYRGSRGTFPPCFTREHLVLLVATEELGILNHLNRGEFEVILSWARSL